MNEPFYMDAEFEPIEAMFKNRNRKANQLPGKVVHFIPEENAPRVLELDKRIQKIQKLMPYISAAALSLASLIIGMNL